MSDTEVVEPKKGRGRPPNAEKNSVAPKKRARALSPKESKLEERGEKDKVVASDDGEEPSPKRGRGRPKGSTKKVAKPTKKAPSAPVGRGRGRGKKKPMKEESSEEEDDDDDEDEEDDEPEDSEGNEENYGNDESDS
ncbi:nucleolin-like [Anopheles coustani]|uniref:AGAP004213-PA-like protein n=2 Tax=Myzorhynchus TaxID=58250 RepID=A0A084VKA1_ANOSI|nr:nucleolin-like [Anopheles coustani]KFB38395.1 AGAP004213-PA-like protein [Anopheles sinensis]